MRVRSIGIQTAGRGGGCCFTGFGTYTYVFVILGVGAESCCAVDLCGKNFEDLIQLNVGRIIFLSLSAHLVFELMFLNAAAAN